MQIHAMSFSVKPLMLNIKAAAFHMRWDFSECEKLHERLGRWLSM